MSGFGGKVESHERRQMSALAQSGQLNCTRVCPLLDQSGHWWVSACGGLSANDPKQMFRDDIYDSVGDHDGGPADERDLFPRGLFNLRS